MSKLGYVYAIEFDNGTVKVGRTTQPEKRLSQHESAGKAFGVSVMFSWVSDAHENYETTESRLIASLGEPLAGNEWFRCSFADVVQTAQSLVLLQTEPELYHKRLMDAVRVVEQHTGRKLDLRDTVLEVPELNVTDYFELDDRAWMMSSVAFNHYVQSGGTLNQKKFLLALEDCGVKRRRVSEGSRLEGIAIPFTS